MFAFAFMLSASSTNAALYRDLQLGSSGADVKELQVWLNSCPATALGVPMGSVGAPGMESEKFGPATQAAVINFQSANGVMPAAGYVGAKTRAAMASFKCTTTTTSTTTTTTTTGTTTTGTLPAGCTTASGFSTTLANTPCTPVASNLPAGCTSTTGFSSSTGNPCSGSSSTTPTTSGPLQGGAGDISITSTSTDVESDVKEGDTENVLGVKVEADGSDLALTSVRVELEHASGSGSTKPDRYMDTVKVMLAGKEVGSIDVSDLTKDGSIYRGSISLSSATVREDKKETLHVAVETLDSVDNVADTFDVRLIQVRYQDAEGVVSTEGTLSYQETFGFDDVGIDDDIAIKSSSSNPDAATLKVEENDSSDEYLVLQFKLDVDDKSSDMVLNSLPIRVTIADGGTTADSADMVIEEVRVQIGSDSFDADLESEDGSSYDATPTTCDIGLDYCVENGDGIAIYTADIDGDVTIKSGDTVDVKVYATFKEQDTNYDANTKVTFDAVADLKSDGTGIANNLGTTYDMDVEGEDTIDASTIGTASGDEMNLALTKTEFSSYSWTETEGTGTAIVDFFVTIKAEDEDFTLLATSVIGTATRNSGSAIVLDHTDSSTVVNTEGYFVLSKVSGDATASGSDFIINEGDTARFRVRIPGTTAGTASTEATITSIGGQEVPDDKQLSPTAVVQ